jgi:hypothetical protein
MSNGRVVVVIEVLPCSPESSGVVSKISDSPVAPAAQQSAHLLRRVAVVNAQFFVIGSAYLALATASLVQRLVML